MYCLDTYAFIEIIHSNPRYIRFFETDFVITEITMAEIYTVLYREYNKQTADYWYRKLRTFCVPVPLKLLIGSVAYRVDHRKENLSFFDCVGYMYAVTNNLQFVTGDKEFKGKKGVLFVK